MEGRTLFGINSGQSWPWRGLAGGASAGTLATLVGEAQPASAPGGTAEPLFLLGSGRTGGHFDSNGMQCGQAPLTPASGRTKCHI